MKNDFHGLIVPLITPFNGGKVDFDALGKIMERCLRGGADAFVALGTTAETPTLTDEEKVGIFKFVRANSCGKKVIAGVGTNCTASAVGQVKIFEDLGADGILAVCPFYNKPPKTGIIAHFCIVAESTRLPVILYDVPSRTGTEIGKDAIIKLRFVHNIIGIKAAYATQGALAETAELKIDGIFDIFGGNDLLTVQTLEFGGVGLISAAANVIPEFFSGILKAPPSDRAALYARGKALVEALYLETNPVVIKYAMSKAGLCENELRLPMCPISRKNGILLDIIYSDCLKEIL